MNAITAEYKCGEQERSYRRRTWSGKSKRTGVGVGGDDDDNDDNGGGKRNDLGRVKSARDE